MKLQSDPRVKEVYDAYPQQALTQLRYLRSLILDVASEIDGLENLEETLKWGEPSYLTKHGSTIRMDWKAKSPEQVALYFQCSTNLVATFKTLYGTTFTYEGNRALVFRLSDTIPEDEVKQCISMALRYHKLKHLPFLGM